jgi:hypothetical protein
MHVVLLAIALLTSGPVNTSPPSVVGHPVSGGLAQASSGTWTGNGPITYAYAWETCDASGASCQPLYPGPGSPQYTGQTVSNLRTAPGSYVRVVVTATDANGSSTLASATAKVVASTTSGGGGGTTTTSTSSSLALLQPKNGATVTQPWVHVVVRYAGRGNVLIQGKQASPGSGPGTYRSDVSLPRIGRNTIRVRVASTTKTYTVVLRYPSVLVVGFDSRESFESLGCDPCRLPDPVGDAAGGPDVDWATSRHVGSKLIHTIHTRNSIGAGIVCLQITVLHPHARGDGYSVNCYGRRINTGENSFVGPETPRRIDDHTLEISFSATSIGSPPAYLWRVWTNAGDHLTYDLAPSAPGHGGPAQGRTVKQQLRFQTGPQPSP